MKQSIIRISGTYREVSSKVDAYTKEGYKIVSQTKAIDWPYFWRYRVNVIMYERAFLDRNNRYMAEVAAMFDRSISNAIARCIDSAIMGDVPLSTQLQQAIEQENYEEAARLRDLMSKSK